MVYAWARNEKGLNMSNWVRLALRERASVELRERLKGQDPFDLARKKIADSAASVVTEQSPDDEEWGN